MKLVSQKCLSKCLDIRCDMSNATAHKVKFSYVQRSMLANLEVMLESMSIVLDIDSAYQMNPQ